MKEQSSSCSIDSVHHGKMLPNRVWLTVFLEALLALAVAAVYSAWVYALQQEELLRFQFSGRPLPPLTRLFLQGADAFITFLLPWVIYAVGVVVRGRINPRELIAFASTLSMALLMGGILFAFGMHLSWVPYSMSYGSRWSRSMDMERLVLAFHAADRGDPEAYYRLHEHYIRRRQQNLAEYYLGRAAELGHAEAKKNLERRERAKQRESMRANDLRKRSRAIP